MLRSIIRFLVWRVIVKSVLKFYVGVSFEGKFSQVKEKQFIIVANHNSHLDTGAILASLTWEQLKNTKPVAAADYFGKTNFRASMSQYFLNCLLIKRSKKHQGDNPIEAMSAELKKGHSLIIFPEGSRGKVNELQCFKSGIGILLERHPEIPFLPAYLDSIGKAMPKGDGLLVPFNSRLIVGEPTWAQNSKCIKSTVNEVEISIKELRDNTIVSKGKSS